MKRLIGIATLLALSACATPEEIEARRIAREQQDIEICLSYGLKQGSESFGMCRLQLDLAREQRYNNYNNYPPHIWRSPYPYIDPNLYRVRPK